MMDLAKYQEKRICVALSGGADSVSLLHYLQANAFSYGYFLSAVNCEHGIRGESSLRDSRFVQELCKAQNIPLFSFSEDCPAKAKREKVSLETAARDFRYQAFESLLEDGKCDYIALAHHADDEAETVLFRLARGTALDGLTGMKEENGRYLRPFLSWDKKKIIAYATEHSLLYCEDESNFEKIATRNILRLDVLPALNSAVDGATENLLRFAQIAAEDDALLYSLARDLVVVDKPRFLGDTGRKVIFCDKKPLFRRACLCVLKELGIVKDYTKRHLDALCALQDLQTGATLTLPQNILAKKEYDGIAFLRLTATDFTSPKAGEGGAERDKIKELVFGFGKFAWGRYEITISSSIFPAQADKGDFGVCLRFDADKIPLSAVFRTRQTGDIFRKFKGGEKSLKKYLIDEKIPSYLRDELPILADGDRVLLIGGVEISDQIKVDENTKNLAYLAIKQAD